MRRSYKAKAAVKRNSIIRDAYGFEVPQNLASLYSEHTSTWVAEEKRRTDKWLQFLKDICPPEHQQKNVIFAGFWDEVLEASLKRVVKEQKTRPGGSELGDRLDSLVRMGIPSFLRSYTWGLFLGYDSEKTPGLFKLLSSQTQSASPSALRPSRTVGDDTCGHRHLLRRYSSADSKELESLDENDTYQDEPLFHCEQTVEQINKDLDRTFPGHPLMDASGKEALRQILVAFSHYRPDIGYCQGMNFISGLLLLFHQPEDAFWNLSSIIEHLLPNQFDRDMLPAVVDKLVFSHLVQQYFPELALHLDELAVDVSYLCPHWFLCCFVNALPMETCLRVWDILFWERKPNVLFKVALALVDFYSEDLMNIRNTAQAWEQLQNMAASFFDSSRLIETACLKFDDVDEFRVGELRHSYLDRIKEQSIKGLLSAPSAERDVRCRVDLLGKGSNFGNDDVSATTTPTKILAASASLVRNSSAFSSTSSTIGTRGQGDVSSSLRGDDNRRLVRDLLMQLQETGSTVPDDVCSKIHELIDRLAETETECRDAQLQLNATCKEITKANEANRSLKGRLGAVYTELDKKNECLDRMIAKCQILTEKVAAQEEVICKQRRMMFYSEGASTPNNSHASSTAARVTSSRDRGTQSLKNLFAFRR